MCVFYRLATDDEIAFYTHTLYPLQDRVFEGAAVYGDALYLTGGTALSRFHFQHRLSDDLDFFLETDDLQRITYDLALRLEERGLSVRIEQADVYFARFYVHAGETSLKVDMVRAYHRIGALEPTEAGIRINGLEDIGANKVTAFEDRAEIKDILDLYFIHRQIPLEHLFALADQKRVPVAYEQLLTINAEGLSGMALVTQDIDPDALSRFVDILRQHAEAEVKKKETLALNSIQTLVNRLLWDFPPEARNFHTRAIPVLQRRSHRLPLPERRALQHHLRESMGK